MACNIQIFFTQLTLHLPCLAYSFLDFAAELLTTNKLSELACLALYLMYEKKQGKASFWYPFIRELDRQRGRGQLAVESPLLWSESELAYLDGSHTKVIGYQLAYNHKCSIIYFHLLQKTDLNA